MREITPEEIERVKSTSTMGGKYIDIIKAMDQLEIGKGFVVTKEEWGKKSTPASTFKPRLKKTGKNFSFARLQDGEWGILRTK